MRRLLAAFTFPAFLLSLPVGGALSENRAVNTSGACNLGDNQTLYRLYREAAEKGDAAAQALVAGMYLCGENVPRDYAEAAKWYRMAAEQGHAGAQYNLGILCASGQGVPQDDAEAAKWYRMAAEQGYADAQYDLAAMYEKGRGVAKDLLLAYMWLDLAASRFSKDEDRKTAAESRDRIAWEMTPAQIAEARNLARERRLKIAEN